MFCSGGHAPSQVFTHGRDSTVCSLVVFLRPEPVVLFRWTRQSRGACFSPLGIRLPVKQASQIQERRTLEEKGEHSASFLIRKKRRPYRLASPIGSTMAHEDEVTSGVLTWSLPPKRQKLKENKKGGEGMWSERVRFSR